jgi:DNA-binding transcriptional LysR family regulator
MRHGITHRMIEAFRAVVAAGNISQAAAALNVSQPSVSRLISDLEARLGLVLFDRRGPRLTVRAEALELYDEVEQSFQGLERVVQRGRRIAASRSGALTIAAIPTVALTILPQVLAGLRQHRDVPEVRLHIGHSQAVLLQLVNRHCDVAISTMHASEATGRLMAWFEVPYVLLVPSEHRLTTLDRAALPSDIINEPLIVLGEGSQTRLSVERSFSEAGHAPRIVAETHQALSASQFVLSGFGVAVADNLAGHWHVAMGGKVLPWAGEAFFSFGLYSTGASVLDALVEDLASAIRNYVEVAQR